MALKHLCISQHVLNHLSKENISFTETFIFAQNNYSYMLRITQKMKVQVQSA